VLLHQSLQRSTDLYELSPARRMNGGGRLVRGEAKNKDRCDANVPAVALDH
jgi:hypothetical protein